MSQDGEAAMPGEIPPKTTASEKAVGQGKTSRGIPTYRALKPPNSMPKPLSRPSSVKNSKPVTQSKENDSAPKAATRTLPPSSRPGSGSATAPKPRPGCVRAAAGPQPVRMARRPASGGRSAAPPPPPPSSAGEQAGRPSVKTSVAAARRGRPRPRGMATVGGAAPLYATPGDTSQLHPAVIKAARRSGQLNLSSRDMADGESRDERLLCRR